MIPDPHFLEMKWRRWQCRNRILPFLRKKNFSKDPLRLFQTKSFLFTKLAFLCTGLTLDEEETKPREHKDTPQCYWDEPESGIPK